MILVTEETIKDKIYTFRGQKVMLDFDLAELYGYETRYLNQQVGRNSEKFEGDDFMFQLTDEEFHDLMLQNVTSRWGGTRKLPFAFTEQGIYMLMTVLKGELAVKQSRALVRLFKQMRDYIGLKTLYLLKDVPKTVDIIIFSDNRSNHLTNQEFVDFCTEYPNLNISFKKTEGSQRLRLCL